MDKKNELLEAKDRVVYDVENHRCITNLGAKLQLEEKMLKDFEDMLRLSEEVDEEESLTNVFTSFTYIDVSILAYVMKIKENK